MHTRNTVLMAALLIVLAGFVYFWEIRGRGEREDAERQANLLVRFEIEDVERVEVTTAAESVVAVKGEDGWRIEQPVAAAADGEAIDSLIDRLHNATPEREVVESAVDLAPFGLDSPTARVTVGLADGTSVTAAIGKETPVGANVYAMAGDSEAVYIIAATIRGGLEKSLFDLRDKTVLPFDESAITGIELTVGGVATSLQRDDGGSDEPRWTATQPFDGRADADTIDDLLSALHTADAVGYVLDSAPDADQLAAYGLAQPEARVALRDGAGATYELLVGGAADEPAGRYAMRGGGSSVFVVDASIMDDLPARPEVLRNKQVVALARERVKTLRIQQGDSTVALERAGVDWRIVEPRPLAADASVVSGLLSSLQDLRAEGFAEGLGGATTLTVTVGLGDPDAAGIAETIDLRVGTLWTAPFPGDSDEPIDTRAVAVTGDGTFYLVADEDLEDLRADLYALRAKTLVQFTQTDLSQLEVTAGGSTWTIDQTDGAWSLVAPTQRPLEEDVVADLLWDINYLRMEAVTDEWDPGAAPALETWGLATPRFTVVARTADGVAASIRIGNEVDGAAEPGRVFALVGDRPGVFEIRASVADAIEELAERLRAE